MILYGFDKQGGFEVADLTTGRTAYAYPTSTHANAAQRKPERVAREMVKQANDFAYPGGELGKRLAAHDAQRVAGLLARADGAVT